MEKTALNEPLFRVWVDTHRRIVSFHEEKGCKLLEFRLSSNNRSIIISFPIFSSILTSFSYTKPKIHSNRISRNKKFWKNN